MSGRKLVLQLSVLLVIFSLGVSSIAGQKKSRKEKEEEARAAKANAANTFSVEQLAPEFQLAVEIEVAQDEIKPVGATIVRSVSRSNSALSDLRVRARAGDKVIAEYTIPDPRLVEVEREGQRSLPTARTFIFAPLSTGLTEFEISPVEGREKAVSKGGKIDALPLARRACQERREIKECLELLKTPAPLQ